LGWSWLIKTFHIKTQQLYKLLPTTAGYKRIDVIVVNTQNSFQAISGTETLGSPQTINTNRHIEVTFIIVGDTGIETTSLLISSELCYKKNYVDQKLGSKNR
jgi:hypothetical protein